MRRDEINHANNVNKTYKIVGVSGVESESECLFRFQVSSRSLVCNVYLYVLLAPSAHTNSLVRGILPGCNYIALHYISYLRVICLYVSGKIEVSACPTKGCKLVQLYFLIFRSRSRPKGNFRWWWTTLPHCPLAIDHLLHCCKLHRIVSHFVLVLHLSIFFIYLCVAYIKSLYNFTWLKDNPNWSSNFSPHYWRL